MTWFRRSAHPEEDLSAYVDGELGDRARRAVETHLASCEACSTLLKELQDAKSLLRELPSLQPRRSLALGSEFAVDRRAVPAPRRATFTFAPAVALTVLVALLFVDAIGSNGGSSNDEAFSTAGSTAASEAAPEAAAGLALESSKAADGESAAIGAADSSSAPAGDAGAGTAGGALAPETTQASEPAPGAATATAAEQRPAPLTRETTGESEDAGTNPTSAGPQETSQPADAEDSSDGLSTLRILEIVAALVFVGSLTAVFLPRIVGRKER